MSDLEKRFVFYVPASEQGKPPSVIDAARLNGGEYVGVYSRRSYDAMAKDYAGLLVGDADEVMAQYYDALKTEPVQIERDRFIEMLEVLPPNDWQRVGSSESFKMSEHYSGVITSIYARVGNRYYQMHDDYRLSHAEILAKIEAAHAAQPLAA